MLSHFFNRLAQLPGIRLRACTRSTVNLSKKALQERRRGALAKGVNSILANCKHLARSAPSFSLHIYTQGLCAVGATYTHLFLYCNTHLCIIVETLAVQEENERKKKWGRDGNSRRDERATGAQDIQKGSKLVCRELSRRATRRCISPCLFISEIPGLQSLHKTELRFIKIMMTIIIIKKRCSPSLLTSLPTRKLASLLQHFPLTSRIAVHLSSAVRFASTWRTHLKFMCIPKS